MLAYNEKINAMIAMASAALRLGLGVSEMTAFSGISFRIGDFLSIFKPYHSRQAAAPLPSPHPLHSQQE